MSRRKAFVSWLFFAAGAVLLLQGGSLLYPLLNPVPIENPVGGVSIVHAAIPAEAPLPGTPLFVMSLPRLQKTLAVVEGTTTQALRIGPGHLEGTALPGQPGNMVLAGHRDTHFRMLKDIRMGDEIWIGAGTNRHGYRVSAITIVAPDDLSPLETRSDPELTLITCYPFYYLGPAPKRFIVKAVPFPRLQGLQ